MKKETKKLQLSKRGKKLFKMYAMAICIGALTVGTSMNVLAADDPMTVVNNLSDFIFGLIRAVGMIILGFGIVQVGLSLKSCMAKMSEVSGIEVIGVANVSEAIELL